jgi:phosphatidylglycerophosphatase A
MVEETPAESQRSVVDYVALAIATCGVGFMPIAPGTWGSLVGLGIFLSIGWSTWPLLASAGPSHLDLRPGLLAMELVAILIITLSGIWAASRVEELLGRKDPGKVVVDEVAGQMISLLPLAVLSMNHMKVWILVSFFLFRLFDIVKPYPARRFEALHGGLGIMADDLVAGFYGALATAMLIVLFLNY